MNGGRTRADLVLPAEMVTAESVNFMVTHARGLLCMPMLAPRLRELEIPMLGSQHSVGRNAHGLYYAGGLQTRHYYRYFRRRPGGHRPGFDFPGGPGGGLFPPRPSFPLALSARRRAGAGRAYRGHCGPVPHRRNVSGRRGLRNNERRRFHVPPTGSGTLRPAPRPENPQHRPDYRLPSPPRILYRAGSRGPPADPVRGVPHLCLPQPL